MDGRRYGDGLHQAIEAKEESNYSKRKSSYCIYNLSKFFRTYEKLSGMTGTALTKQKSLKEYII